MGCLEIGSPGAADGAPRTPASYSQLSDFLGLRLVPGRGRTGRLMFPPYLSSLMILIIRPGKNIFFFLHFFEKARLA